MTTAIYGSTIAPTSMIHCSGPLVKKAAMKHNTRMVMEIVYLRTRELWSTVCASWASVMR